MLSLIAATLVVAPSLRISSVFSDHMVLQRDMRTPVFGVSAPGTNVDVELAGHRYRTRANDSGRWLVHINPLPAGGPHTMTVRGGGTRVIRDVMVGEVWVASGQSNMEWRVAWASDPEKDLFDTNRDIRFFTVGRQSVEAKAEDVRGAWVPTSRQAVYGFSAVAYSFAKELHRELKVPIGIIHSSWGGTPAESWMSRSALLDSSEFAPIVNNYLASLGTFGQRRAEYEQRLALYNAEVFRKDPGNEGYHMGWAEETADLTGWRKAIVPGAWETRGLNIDGAVWYRREVIIPDHWAGKDLRVDLGTIEDLDITYFNGNRIGFTAAETRDPEKVKRSYRVSPGLVRKGANTIAVRVFDRFGDGGLTGDATEMQIYLDDDDDEPPIPLAGEWLYRIEKSYPPVSQAVLNAMPVAPVGPGHPQAPGSLWNGMVAPLVPYGIRGTIWYQGESNAPRASQYRRLFPALISDWRAKWGQGDFPFYFVQLANFRARKPEPSESDWAELREAQFLATRLPRTGMAVTIDIGEADAIHPLNKREVGRRLALHALAKDYGRSLIRTGPIYKSIRVTGADAQVFFDAVGERLRTSDGGPVRGFAIAGADRRWVWANARISGSSVVVSSTRVAKPVAVRYAWADNPDCNLVNSAGLPTSPFRTDDWPGITR